MVRLMRAAVFLLLAALTLSACARSHGPQPSKNFDEYRHYRLADRAVHHVEGEPEFLDVVIPSKSLGRGLFSAPLQGEQPGLYVSVPAPAPSEAPYFCRMTYSSPGVSGPVGQEFSVDETIAPRFGVPEGFDCRHGYDVGDRRFITYYCEDRNLREQGTQLETWCKFENTIPTATCMLFVRTPKHAYLDCEYLPRDVSKIRAMAETLSERVDAWIE